MQITVRVPKELEEQARSRGMKIEAYIQDLLERKVKESVVERPRKHSSDEISRWLESLAQFSDKIPALPARISREWIYHDHD